jgi:hypothetical protein
LNSYKKKLFLKFFLLSNTFEGHLKINIMRNFYKYKTVYIDLPSKELFRFISINFTLNGNKAKEKNNKKLFQSLL